jgi:hypothetical protein
MIASRAHQSGSVTVLCPWRTSVNVNSEARYHYSTVGLGKVYEKTHWTIIPSKRWINSQSRTSHIQSAVVILSTSFRASESSDKGLAVPWLCRPTPHPSKESRVLSWLSGRNPDRLLTPSQTSLVGMYFQRGPQNTENKPSMHTTHGKSPRLHTA